METRRSRPLARLAFLLTSLMALATPAIAQGPRVYARLSAGVLRLGDTGALAIHVDDAEDARIVSIPTVEGLEIGRPGRPNRSSYTSIVNGRVSSQVSVDWQLSLRPSGEGDYEIPPIEVEIGGRRFATQPQHLTVVVDLEGEDLGFLEVRPASTHVIEGQPFSVEVLFGWDSSTQVNFAELNLPWWDALPGAIELDSPQARDGVKGIHVNREFEVVAEQVEPRQRGGRSLHTLRLVRTYLPTRSGALEFPTSFFEFGQVQRTSVFDLRPSRRRSHFVQAPAFAVDVVPLPTEGQPLDFSGAVGSLSVRASADARDVRVGDSIKFTVQWSGSGNLQFFAPPDPAVQDAFGGFRVYGSTEEKAFDRRTVVYDLAPLSTELTEIPSLSLSVFDPEAGRYIVLATEPIPIRVRPLEGTSSLEEVEKEFERDIADLDVRPLSDRSPRDRTGLDRFLGGALVLVPLLGLILRAGVRRRGTDPGAPLERRRRRARRELARALQRATGPSEQRAAFLEYLGARTREPAAAWDGRDPARNGAAKSLPEAHREGTGRLLARLDAAVWAGAPAVPSDELIAAARALEGEGL
jgi:hypothetical protein